MSEEQLNIKNCYFNVMNIFLEHDVNKLPAPSTPSTDNNENQLYGKLIDI